MSSNSTQQLTHSKAPTLSDNEIDLRQVFGALGRHKHLIAGIASGSLLISTVYAFTRTPVWEGQFQIVLENEQRPNSGASQLIGSNPALASIVGIGANEGNQLGTEVKILESPSVLKPVFDFVKKSKAENGKSVEGMRYSNWVNSNLTIALEKGTSVLNIAYRDTDKKLILPVIERISKTYQNYSGRDRERGLAKAIKYLEQQTEIYKIKAVKSLRTAQQYAIEQDLTALQENNNGDAEIISNINIEAIRVQAANEIRKINEQLKQIRKAENNPEKLLYLASAITDLSNGGLLKNLEDIDTQLALSRSKFTDNDDSVRRLIEKDDFSMKYSYNKLLAISMPSGPLLKPA